MEHGDPRTEAGAEERFLLGGERDLRNQQQRAPARFQAGGDRLEIDLGLPAAGDPVEQEGAEGARLEGLPEDARSLPLGSGERRRARQRPVFGIRRPAGESRLGREPLGADGEKTLALEAGEAPPRGEFKFAADADQRDRAAGDGEQGEDAPVVLAQPRQRASGTASGPGVGFPEARRALGGDERRAEHPAGGRRGREHRLEDQSDRTDRHLGETARQGEEIFRERRQRVVEARPDGLEDNLLRLSALRRRRRAGAEDHPGEFAGAEGDPHPGAGRQRGLAGLEQRGRRLVGVRRRHRTRHRDLNGDQWRWDRRPSGRRALAPGRRPA